jgi:exoribonuclease II
VSQVVYDDNGEFKPGQIVSEAGGSLQIQTHTGKRVKVKASHVVLRFNQTDTAAFFTQAQVTAQAIDLDLLWECAPQDECSFEDLAVEYFGTSPSVQEQYALLLRVHSAPVYFYRKGRGRYRAAPKETLQAALAAVERKKQQLVLVDQWAHELAGGQCPEEIKQQAAQLLAAPDKNGMHYKALAAACDLAGLPPERLLLNAGAFKSARDLHQRRFFIDAFAHGLQPKAAGLSADIIDLPLAPVRAFSIDDSSTTEIDDCLSVQWQDNGQVVIGIHIAAPGIALLANSPADLAARERMSTLYMPGDKITMLPDDLVRLFSLDEGREVATLSLYVPCDPATQTVLWEQIDTRLERIQIAANLRHDLLDHAVTEAALEGADTSAFVFFKELSFLWQATQWLGAERDKVRGKPEARNRADFNFKVDAATDQVQIIERQRNAPLDRIVAEMMILANNQWGKFLANQMTPAIYRSQQMGRVKMTTYPQPHQGLGVSHYGWFTSPLRRYSDLVNQRQLLAVLAREAAPYAANDAGLYEVIAAFEARYASYNEFQNKMERYWCLRWIAQHDKKRFTAVVVKPEVVRLQGAPLYLPLAGLPEIGLGRQVIIDILALDELELSVEARFIELGEVGSTEEMADPV